MPPGALVRPNTIATPEWRGDFGGREHIVPFGAILDPTQFKDAAGVVVTVGAGGAAAAATTVPVTALPAAVPAGALLDFGTNKFARLTADAAAGAVSIAVAAIPTALVAGDAAVWSQFGSIYVPSGTIIGRTRAERDANALWGPGVNTDFELFLTYNEVPDILVNASVSLYRHRSLVKENYLPGYATVLSPAGVDSALMTAIRGLYMCEMGTD